ncbi:unnamed protein product, partial [Durusdinium trenchii]
ARKIASSPRSLSPNASVQSTKPQPNWNGGTPGEVGPGTYNTDKLSLARAAGARFGASHRFSPPDRASSPGPGAYETSVRSLTKGHQFQRAAVTTSRPSIPDSSSKSGPVATPGPAAYDTVAATRSTKKRMPVGMSHYDETSANVNLQKASIAHSALSIVLFDARGHGASSGWEGGGPDQFHWRCLGSDMLQVALAHTAALVKPWAPSYILGGCSMGAAAAVWAALLSPRCVRGLVLYMVPTMWAGRKTRRGALEARANAVRQTDPVRADVMLGAARADFPPREDVERLAATGIQVWCLNYHVRITTLR